MRGKRVVNRQSDCGWMRCHCVILALCVAGSALGTVGCEDKEAASTRLKVAQVHKLVTVGMDIEQAVEKLEKNDIPVGGPWDHPQGGYAVVRVRNIEKSHLEMMADVLRLRDTSNKYSVILNSNEAGEITSIEDPKY